MTDERLTRLVEKCHVMVVAEFGRRGLPETYRDDLVQEMALVLLRLDGHKTDAYYLRRAMWAGVEWLRRARRSWTTDQTYTFPSLTHLVDGGRCLRVWI